MINLFKKLKTLNEQKRYFKEKAVQGKPLCAMDDVVFKIMLSSDTEDSREALRSLLSAYTRREVTKVQILNSELLPVHLEGKKPLLDVKVTFNDRTRKMHEQIEKKKIPLAETQGRRGC